MFSFTRINDILININLATHIQPMQPHKYTEIERETEREWQTLHKYTEIDREKDRERGTHNNSLQM